MTTTTKRPLGYSLAAIISPEEAALLRRAGIRSSGRLLELAKDMKGRKALAAQLGIDEHRILQWANLADRMRIKGVGKDYAELMTDAGVTTVRELKYRNPGRLAQAMAAANAKSRRVQILPSEKVVERWIEAAKKLPLKITY